MRVVIGGAILVEGILSVRHRHGFDGPIRTNGKKAEERRSEFCEAQLRGCRIP